MTFAEYQTEALKTAKFKDEHALPYLRLGLISEVGEVAGKVKKWIRDQGADPALLPREAIADELGDVLWYVAVLAHYSGFDIKAEDIYNYFSENKEGPCIKLVPGWSEVLFEITAEYTERSKYNRLVSIISSVNEFSLPLGFTLEDIMTRNIEKLRSRQERGVIGGSGDNR